MASVDSGVETSNDSNDSSATDPQVVGSPASKSKEIILFQVPPPMIVPNSFDSWVADAKRRTGEETLHFRCPILPTFSSLPLSSKTDYLFSSDVADCRRNHGSLKVRRASAHCSLSASRGVRLITGGFHERKLRIAVMSNNIEQVQNSLWIGVNPNCHDTHMRTPLHLAACRGYADIVRLLLDNGADPNQRDLLGNTPLHLAACTNNVVVVTLLLKAGTDVKSVDDYGRNPLQIAQSKLKLLQKLASDDISTQIKNQVYQIIEMLREFLNRRGQDMEAELINSFSTRLTMSKTMDQVENQVRELLASLPHLSLDDKKCIPDNDNGSGRNNNSLIDSNIVDEEKGVSINTESPRTSGTSYLFGERPTFSLRSAWWTPSVDNFCNCNLAACRSCSKKNTLAPTSIPTSSATSSGSFESLME